MEKFNRKKKLLWFDANGYTFVGEEEKIFFRGERKKGSLKDYLKIKEKKEQEDYKIEVVGSYKIHCMPYANDIVKIAGIILDEIKRNENLQTNIFSFKIYKNYQKTLTQSALNERIFPRIVIYPATGKNKAQIALNEIYRALKGFEGINITPSYNAKVTSLLYVAQGDGDFKDNEYDSYYEPPDKIYYNTKEFPPVKPDIDHYLVHPETKKPLL